ncbi:MAG: putative Amylo-alpha,6-glucosidase [Conexibacter sp.]|nr:putative Amylo-alpha,6-glucosidase [Conexibacter sp.]
MPETTHHLRSTTPAPDVAAGPVVSLTDAIVLKEEGVFLMSLRDGTIPVTGTHPLGLYLDDCRHLSGHELRVAGVMPRLLVASAPTGAEAIYELTNPDIALADGRELPLQTLQVRIERRLLSEGRLRERVHVRLHGREAVDLDLELALGADFRPMFAIRGIVDVPPATVELEQVEDGLRFAATTSDDVRRSTTVFVDRPPTAVEDRTLRFGLHLEPGGSDDVRLEYIFGSGGPDGSRSASAGAAGGDGLGISSPTRVQTDDELFNRVIRRSVIDLRMLRSRLEGDAYFAAGVPWFATLFGRDSLITAIETLGLVPDVGAQTLRALGARLGRRVDPIHEEEPGKVLHELRVGEVAARDLTPLTRYYGTVDATPLFLCLVAEHADWSGSLDLFRELRGAVDAALGWIERYGDHDGDGLLDYRAGTPDGLRNQGWKDSEDGVLHDDGTPMEPPIALVEVQGYAIRGLRGTARLLELDGDGARATELLGMADALEERLERFWVPDRRIYGMGIDGEGRTSAALASNQGHLLWGEVLHDGRARDVRDALMSDAMFSGWGLRTLGRGEQAYNPVGYHLGTVWPHDTAMAAVGLRRYGFDQDFTRLFEGLLEAASHTDGYSLPELFAGFASEEYETPVPYPVACHPQAWASGAIPYMLINGLGLKPDGLQRRLRVRRPSLPSWVNRVDVEGLAIGAGRVDLRFERTGAGDSVALTDARIDGDVDVVLEIQPGH